jgi:hypothetical protein
VPHAAAAETAECRQCCAFCDRVLLPSGCLDSGCPYLYLYDDERTGRRFMGCLNKVFKVEIDVELFREAERTRHGYGGVKLTGAPIPRCRTTVERAYHGGGDAFACVNPRFFDEPLDDDASAAGFDLRNGL